MRIATPPRRVALAALAALAAACSGGPGDDVVAPDGDARPPDAAPVLAEAERAALERDFLAAIQGEWTGTLRETPPLEKRVMRETPMRLVVEPEGAPIVEYATGGCRGTLASQPDASPPSTATTLRLFQQVSPKRSGSVCEPGPVRLIRGEDPDALEFAFLGDTLRRIQATLHRTP